MTNIIYVIASGTNDQNEATTTNFFNNITEVFEFLESLKASEDMHLKTQGTKKPLRSTRALDICLDDDTVYVELLEKTRTKSWYNINKLNLEVILG